MQTDCFPESDIWDKGPVSALATQNPNYRLKRGKEYPFLEMSAVKENFGGISGFEQRKFEGSGLARFKKGDILFAKITPCAENGKIAHVTVLSEEYGLGSTEFIVLSPKQGVCPRFLYHLACCHSVRGRACARMEGSTGRQRVPDDVFEQRLLVPLPEPLEQEAIAAALDVIDCAIERARVAVDKAAVLKWAVVADYFQSNSWSEQRLGRSVTDIRYGTSQASNDSQRGYPTLRIPNIVSGSLDLNDISYVELSSTHAELLKLADGDLLLVRTNGNPHYVGRSCVFTCPDGQHWAYASYLIRIRLCSRVKPEFVQLYLSTPMGRKEVLRRVTTSAGNNNLNAASVRLIPLPTPEVESQQDALIDIAKAHDRQIAALKKKYLALTDLKSGVMRDVLSGRLRCANSFMGLTEVS